MPSTIHTPDIEHGAGAGHGNGTGPGHSQQGARVRRVAERLTARRPQLDEPARVMAAKVPEVLGRGKLRDALRGTWLGHPLHPLLTDVVIGTWLSSAILDLGGKRAEPASSALIAAGLAATVPTVAAGWSDWADTEDESEEIRRMGIVHAASNAAASLLYATSLLARRNGHHGRGVALAYAGLGVLGAGGYLGSHMAYAEGSRVERARPGV